jgi:hypothetical protein
MLLLQQICGNNGIELLKTMSPAGDAYFVDGYILQTLRIQDGSSPSNLLARGNAAVKPSIPIA